MSAPPPRGNARAVAAVYEAKGRPSFNPLIAHVADVAMARRIVAGEGIRCAVRPGGHARCGGRSGGGRGRAGG